MKILHIFDHSLPAGSGYVHRSMAILRQQQALGWQVTALTSTRQPDQPTDIFVADDIHFHRTSALTPTDNILHRMGQKIPTFGLGNYLSDMRALSKSICQLLDNMRPDIIHVHSPLLNLYPALWQGRRHKIPVVYEIRAFWEDAAVDQGKTSAGSMRYKITRFLETIGCRLSKHVFVICDGLCRDLLARGIGDNKVTIIPNAVEAEKFNTPSTPDAQLMTDWGLKEDDIVFGFFGSFYSYEGLENLIKAMPLIIKQQPRFRLLLIGQGEKKTILTELIKQLSLQEHVIMQDYQPQSELPRCYSLCQAMIFPRHDIRLTRTVTPLKPLEAMAAQRLVVASDIGGHQELIENNKTGYLIDCQTPERICDNIINLLEQKENWPSIIKAGHNYAVQERNWRNSVANYENIYHSLVQTAL